MATLAALTRPSTRRHNSYLSACQNQGPGALFNKTSTQSGASRPQPRARVMNVRRSVPVMWGGNTRRFFRDDESASPNRWQPSTTCAPNGKRNPPKGGRKVTVCSGACTNTPEGFDVPLTNCCDQCGVLPRAGRLEGTVEVLKDTVKGNPTAFACGGTNKTLGIYGSGTLKIKEFPEPPPFPTVTTGTDGDGNRNITYYMQPPPAVKTVTVPPLRSYAYSTEELIKRTNTGYDANLAIRACGIGNRQSDGTCSEGCGCGLCCGSNGPCRKPGGWSDGVCPGGMCGGGVQCKTGRTCGPNGGPCKCQSWTYKRRNNQFAATGGVDASLLTAHQGRIANDAATCQQRACIALERAKTPCAARTDCFKTGNTGRAAGSLWIVPRELQQRFA